MCPDCGIEFTVHVFHEIPWDERGKPEPEFYGCGRCGEIWGLMNWPNRRRTAIPRKPDTDWQWR